MKNISILPIEIQYKIIEYLHLENSYAFDIDSVYFYAEPYVFIIDNKILVVSVYAWFGVYNPDRYKRGSILHTIYDRPYSILLERSFSKIANKFCNNLNKFKIKDNLENLYGLIKYSGTYGPVRRPQETKNGINFNKLSNVSYNYKTEDILGYFKEMNLIDNETRELTKEILDYCLNKLKELLIISIKESILSYKKDTNNLILKSKILKYKNNYKDYYCIKNQNKFFYKICKPISDNQLVMNLNMYKKLKLETSIIL